MLRCCTEYPKQYTLLSFPPVPPAVTDHEGGVGLRDADPVQLQKPLRPIKTFWAQLVVAKRTKKLRNLCSSTYQEERAYAKEGGERVTGGSQGGGGNRYEGRLTSHQDVGLVWGLPRAHICMDECYLVPPALLTDHGLGNIGKCMR